MIDINKEAEEYGFEANDGLQSILLEEAFIAGHNSKSTQAKVIQSQIDLILHFKDTFQFSIASSIWRDELIKLQQQLKELEDENNN
jgi:hypothetical protein